MRIALAQLNPTVGDVDGNLTKAREALHRGLAENIDLVVFPELTLLGYPPRDLLLRPDIIADAETALAELAAACEGISAVVGAATINESPGLPLYNSAVLCADGAVQARQHKCLLPNYDVFDERRYFEPARGTTPVNWTPAGGDGVRLGLTVCEDLWNDQAVPNRAWYVTNPVDTLAEQDVGLLTNNSASPFWLGKQKQRFEIFAEQVRRHGRMLFYTNQIGGNDELIFDGGSMAIDTDGRLIAQGRAFDEDFVVVDTANPSAAHIEPYPDELDSLIDGLILGTRDYVRKCGFQEVLVGLSGGIDSAVTAAVAAYAVGAAHVHGVAMPSRYSSEHSLADARALARNLGIELREIGIQDMHAAAELTLRPHFEGTTADATEENLQARIRGQILMALSNKFGWLLLTTGNKSELAVGYCTLYGDMCGGLAVISDVSKTATYAVARRLNERFGGAIPQSTLTKAPSAELRPDQTDQDSLPPYPQLDEILHRYVERREDPLTIAGAGFDPAAVARVIQLVDRNEYKRRQAAPGLKITTRAFGVGWRMPIAARLPALKAALR